MMSIHPKVNQPEPLIFLSSINRNCKFHGFPGVQQDTGMKNDRPLSISGRSFFMRVTFIELQQANPGQCLDCDSKSNDADEEGAACWDQTHHLTIYRQPVEK